MKVNIIKLNSVDSTNLYLKKLINSQNNLPNFLTIWTPKQTNGVGQYGAKWLTEDYKNLTFSTLVLHRNFLLEHYFLLNMIVSVAVCEILEEENIPQIQVKWPNDILSSRFKIGGILIENVIRSNYIEKSIIGIGLNVNQLDFNNLPKASSLKKITQRDFDIEILMKYIVKRLQKKFSQTENLTFDEIYPVYEKRLFQKDKVSAFRCAQGNDFSGIIRKVLPSGELVVEIETGELKNFQLKEIQLLY